MRWLIVAAAVLTGLTVAAAIIVAPMSLLTRNGGQEQVVLLGDEMGYHVQGAVRRDVCYSGESWSIGGEWSLPGGRFWRDWLVIDFCSQVIGRWSDDHIFYYW